MIDVGLPVSPETVVNDSLRFSRDKRFGRKVTFAEFLENATKLVAIVQDIRPSVKVEVLTCEDGRTYNFSTVTFDTEEAEEALQNRRSYTLAQFSEEVWGRSFNVDLIIKDDSDANPFMICLSCDRCADAGRAIFYGQCLDQGTHDQILTAFAEQSLTYKIGDGFPKMSPFNLMYGGIHF